MLKHKIANFTTSVKNEKLSGLKIVLVKINSNIIFLILPMPSSLVEIIGTKSM